MFVKTCVKCKLILAVWSNQYMCDSVNKNSYKIHEQPFAVRAINKWLERCSQC